MNHLTPEESRLVGIVVETMVESGYAESTVNLGRGTLRGILKGGYVALRTPDGRRILLQGRGTPASRKAAKSAMARVSSVFGLEVGLHLSRKGEVSLHRHLPQNAYWPPIRDLLDSLDRKRAVERGQAQHGAHSHRGGRSRRRLDELVSCIREEMTALGLASLTITPHPGKEPSNER